MPEIISYRPCFGFIRKDATEENKSCRSLKALLQVDSIFDPISIIWNPFKKTIFPEFSKHDIIEGKSILSEKHSPKHEHFIEQQFDTIDKQTVDKLLIDKTSSENKPKVMAVAQRFKPSARIETHIIYINLQEAFELRSLSFQALLKDINKRYPNRLLLCSYSHICPYKIKMHITVKDCLPSKEQLYYLNNQLLMLGILKESNDSLQKISLDVFLFIDYFQQSQIDSLNIVQSDTKILQSKLDKLCSLSTSTIQLIDKLSLEIRNESTQPIKELSQLITLYQKNKLKYASVESFSFRSILQGLSKASWQERVLFSLLLLQVQREKQERIFMCLNETLTILSMHLESEIKKSDDWLLTIFEIPYIKLPSKGLELFETVQYKEIPITIEGQNQLKCEKKKWIKNITTWQTKLNKLISINCPTKTLLTSLEEGYRLLSILVQANALLSPNKDTLIKKYSPGGPYTYKKIINRWESIAKQFIYNTNSTQINTFNIVMDPMHFSSLFNEKKSDLINLLNNKETLFTNYEAIDCFSFEPLTMADLAVMDSTPIVPIGLSNELLVLHDGMYMDNLEFPIHDQGHSEVARMKPYINTYVISMKILSFRIESLLHEKMSKIFSTPEKQTLMTNWLIFMNGHEENNATIALFHALPEFEKSVSEVVHYDLLEENPLLKEILTQPKIVELLTNDLLFLSREVIHASIEECITFLESIKS